MTTDFTLHMAPLQGYTEAEYRRAWRDVYGPAAVTYTPFVRFEKGAPCQRTVRDAVSELNAPEGVVPQIIVGSIEEFDALTAALKQRGFRHIDINMGCPFPPQVKRGRGAGTLVRPELVDAVAGRMADDGECTYSVKMRAGVDRPDQWRPVVERLNTVPLTHIAFHARIAADQYRGALRPELFGEFIEACAHPAVFNGDIASPEDIDRLRAEYPSLAGVMAGRGLLARPSLYAEWLEGREWSQTERLDHILRLHALYRDLLTGRLQGDHQILSKLKPFWDYLEPTIGRRAWKPIHKAATLPAYDTAVGSVR